MPALLLILASCQGASDMDVLNGTSVAPPEEPFKEPERPACELPPASEVKKLPRRSNDEYRELASDLLGAPVNSQLFVRWTPIAQVYGFDTMTESRIDAQGLEVQLETATALAKLLTSSMSVMAVCPLPNDAPALCTSKPTYSPLTDFSAVQGQSCWSYLDGSGAPLAFDSATGWYGNAGQGLFVWNSGMHPGNALDAVRRWVAPLEGSIALTGSFTDVAPAGGDGVTVAIRKNGANLFSGVIVNGGAPESFDLKFTLRKGDTVDFVVSRLGNTAYDTTAFTASLAYAQAPLSGGWTWDNCAAPVITHLAGRAFRRPLRPDELADYKALFQNTQSAAATALMPGAFHEGLHTVLEAVLLSPHVMYKPEFVPSGFDESERTFKVASHLSHFFRNSFPDDELWALASSGALKEEALVDAQAKRMLAQYPDRFARSFAGQWLDFREGIGAQPDALTTSMRQEAQSTFEEILRAELPPQSLISPGFAIVDQPLATLYGLPFTAGGSTRQRVATTERGGIFSQGYFLTSTAKGSEFRRVIHRGIWTLNRVMCRSLPELDAATREEIAASVGAINPALPLQEQMKLHRSSSTRCASCHSLMDPIGLSLEKYGPDAKWRETYPSGLQIQNDFDFDGTAVRDPKELATMIEQSTSFRRCVAEKLLTYAMNRGVLESEACVTEEIALPRDGAQPSLKAMTLEAFKLSRLRTEAP